VHRDLKPLNVMLTGHDQIKVLDFGLAQSGYDHSTTGGAAASPNLAKPDAAAFGANPDHIEVTRTTSPVVSPFVLSTLREDLSRFHTSGGMVVGTLGYMSPEQARGEGATTASDMYSFGLVLQELFTGQHPYPTDLDATSLVERVRTGQPEKPAGLSTGLAWLIERLTSLAPHSAPCACRGDRAASANRAPAALHDGSWRQPRDRRKDPERRHLLGEPARNRTCSDPSSRPCHASNHS
jgi:serine/threonine protein kinase